MFRTFDELKVILENRPADSFLVNVDIGVTVHDTFLHFVLDAEIFYLAVLKVSCIISDWKHLEVHLELDALAMENST